MTNNTTMSLTRDEVGTLRSAVRREVEWFRKVVADGTEWGWYDAKERDRVNVHLYEAERLFDKLNQVIKEMDA